MSRRFRFLATAALMGGAAAWLAPGAFQPAAFAQTGGVQSAPLAPPVGQPPATPVPAPATAAPATPPSVTPPSVTSPTGDAKPAEAVPPAAAQTPAPAPAIAQPVPAPSAPAPAPPAVGAVPPAVTPPVVVDPNATLAGKPGDGVNIDDLTLAAKPAAMTTGNASWDNAAATLSKVFARMADEATKAGLKVAGRPLAIFVETDDNNFRYEAYLPVDRVPEGRDTLTADIRFGRTPEGRALRFVHKNAYDDIESTYEAITAYLDAKGVTVRDAFIEEYVGNLDKASDADFEVNIYVQPR